MPAERGHTEAVKILLRHTEQPDSPDRRGRSALHHAASNGHIEVIEQLLQSRVGINRQDDNLRTPLWQAAYSKYVHIVELLSEHKASLTLKDDDGWSALHAACDAPEVTELLIGLGVDVNDKTNSGTTALMLSGINSCPLVAKMLIDAGANLDETNEDGSTALHFAVQEPEILRMFMRKGVDLHPKDYSNRTCLQVAASIGYDVSLSILLGDAEELEGTPAPMWTEDELLDALPSTTNDRCAELLIAKIQGIAETRVTGGYTALQKLFLRGEWDTAVLLIENGADPWSYGGPFVSVVHLATHLKPPTEDHSVALVRFLDMILSKPNDPTPATILSYLQLALELESSRMWEEFSRCQNLQHNLRDPDGWTLGDHSSRANDPFGPIEKVEEQEAHQFLEPSVLSFPKAWEIVAEESLYGFRVSQVEVSSDGLEFECSRKSRPFVQPGLSKSRLIITK